MTWVVTNKLVSHCGSTNIAYYFIYYLLLSLTGKLASPLNVEIVNKRMRLIDL